MIVWQQPAVRTDKTTRWRCLKFKYYVIISSRLMKAHFNHTTQIHSTTGCWTVRLIHRLPDIFFACFIPSPITSRSLSISVSVSVCLTSSLTLWTPIRQKVHSAAISLLSFLSFALYSLFRPHLLLCSFFCFMI